MDLSAALHRLLAAPFGHAVKTPFSRPNPIPVRPVHWNVVSAKSERPRWGQHFLRDRGVLDRIASTLAVQPGEWVVEIGPGRGDLTERLLSRGARVLAVEIDDQLVEHLKNRFRDSTAIEVIHGDILNVNLGELIASRSGQTSSQTSGHTSGQRLEVTGNLPYYITSPIIRRIFGVQAQVSTALLLVQKEVADRIVAVKGTRDYAYLSVLCQLHAESKTLFSVPPNAFQPPPKVTSALVQLKMRDGLGPDPDFLRFLQLCFRQPRKMLRNNLSGAFDREALGALEVTRCRAQQLAIEELRALWDALRPGHPPPAPALMDRS
jgi:16S rRNA (adenine1518-N6/adenine1519-N6)-dimethyltransferase